MNKRVWFCTVCVLLCVMLPLAALAERSMSLEEYESRVTAGVLGQVAGTLTGYEFIWGYDGTPFAPLPEEWFTLLGGPYGGGSARGGAGVSRMLENGVGGDDDYHIDFFSQHILEEEGVLPSYAQIMQQWRDHSVSDWGGGAGAMKLIRQSRLTAPYSGQQEYGNTWHWCTEAYIENETLGLVVPGMPVQAYRLAERFASLTGDYDSLDWGRFWSVAYALAFVEDDVSVLLERASGALLAQSHPMEIYRTCCALYEAQTPWKEAVLKIESMCQYIPDSDNLQCAPDVNNGFAILAVLYGQGDWLSSVQYAAVSGYDADCTAATVGGLLGVMVGMEGMPQEVLDVLWQAGQAVYVNDVNFTPHIQKDYPETQTFGEIAALYVSNGLAQLEAAGVAVQDGGFTMPDQRLERQGMQVDDFEAEEIRWETEGDAAFALSGSVHTGKHSLEISLDADAASASAKLRVGNLTPGATYCVSAYIQTSFDGVGVLAVDGADSVCAYNVHTGWALRQCYFTAQTQETTLHLRAEQAPGDGGVSVRFDDVRLEQINAAFAGEAAQLNVLLERRDQADIPLKTETEGDYALVLRYRSVNRTGQSVAKVSVNGVYTQGAAFPGTAQAADGAASTLVIPLRLAEGENLASLQLTQNQVELLSYALEIWPEAELAD